MIYSVRFQSDLYREYDVVTKFFNQILGETNKREV